MGTNFFRPAQTKFSTPNLNLQARAFASPALASRGNAITSSKDLAGASALSKYILKPGIKDAASAAPGPKKV
jgi:hypothetical protein